MAKIKHFQVSVSNCDCDAGFLCNLYCTDDMGFSGSNYDGATETCCCVE